DALVQANKQRPGQALADARAAVVAGRAVGDAPGSDEQINRVASTLKAFGSIRRTLRQVEEPSDNDLLLTQRLIESEIKEPLLWSALRGDRATADIDWTGVEAAHREALAISRAFGAAPKQPDLVTADTPLAPVERWLRGGQEKLNKAQYLKQLSNAIEL